MSDHQIPDNPETPEELRQLDRTLRRVRFKPRSSLGVELAGRMRRGELPAPRSRAGLLRWWSGPALAGLAGISAVVLLLPESHVTVDRCCYDLDGGGASDDGAVFIGRRDGRVFRLLVYEDSDGSGSLTPQDIRRYDRRGTPVPDQQLPAGGITIQHCCQDLDGGGPADDGIIVLATPPDRVHTAAIYQLR